MKLNLDAINFINVFEKLARVRVKDCVLDDKLIFIINEEDMSKAIGKNGLNVKRAKNLFNKDIQIIGFNEDLVKFIINLMKPYEVQVLVDDKIVNVSVKDYTLKGKILGRDRSNLNRITAIVKRYFDINEIKIR